MPNESSSKLPDVERLQRIMAQLRDPVNGCPWDVKQTMQSLTRYTIEEAYEVVDAISKGDVDSIREELGDLLFQVVFYSQIAQENGEFSFNDVAKTICEKMIRRHPHVFDNTKHNPISNDELASQWERIKSQEKREKSQSSNGLLDNVPSGMPALMRAYKLQKACAKVGFDWPDVAPVLDKVREEVEEIQQELDADIVDQKLLEEEIGDALFAMVNVARHCNIDADTALRNANNKFVKRFSAVETAAKHQGRTLESMSLDEMEALWQKAKELTASS